ncbi:Alpha-1-inhibitor 3 [Chionoecetes opilio]|uniref:Alpha-1-inhibitor 3 n=1 Tax=Chionoecetes opilio TaxID=41210 RepID=A0A8J4YQ64_CHIOP|nr:Alpha-1-inhibitor 3 [Chionoecetes opilio]
MHLEKAQNIVGRWGLGACRSTAVEAIRGDMGWSTFRERIIKGKLVNYIITTPRKWAAGEQVQVCLFSVGGPSEAAAGVAPEGVPAESVEVRVKGNHAAEDLVPPVFVSLPPGKTEACLSVTVPAVTSKTGKLHLRGLIGGKAVRHNETLHFATAASETFVQTDKFLYMPGQKVQFRILTITGPYLKVFSGVYPEMYVESPSGSRLAQWINVDGSGGLIHQEFQLIDEPEEGTYKIHVESPVGGSKAVQTFKVEEFVLPRFEVTLEAPPFILGSDKTFNYKVCATYTYGQPVKGNVTFKIEAKDHGDKQATLQHEEISGCRTFIITEDILKVSDGLFLANTVGATATVTEAGTGQKAKTESLLDVQRQALKFSHVGKEDYVKPNLPFTGQFKVKLPSGAPAAREAVRLCRGDDCKTYTTDATGVVTYIYPKYEDFLIEISSPRYPEVTNPASRWQHIMFKSSSNHRVTKYHSSSSSSLVIKTPKLVSRGQIQYSHTQEYTLAETDLPIDTSLLLFPLPPPATGMVRGAINLPLVVPLTSSPTAKVMVWYSRSDGEVVSDSQEIKIRKCLTNPVSLTWSTDKAEPGDKVNLTVAAAPASLCSLGVVDKSVELLASNEDSLTLDGVFEVAERVMVGDNENTQIDDNEYCREHHPHGAEPLPTPRPRPPFPFPPPPGPPSRPVPFAAEDPARVARRSIWHPPGTYSTNQVDAIKMFDKSGLFVFTDLKVESRPCQFQGECWFSLLLAYGR